LALLDAGWDNSVLANVGKCHNPAIVTTEKSLKPHLKALESLAFNTATGNGFVGLESGSPFFRFCLALPGSERQDPPVMLNIFTWPMAAFSGRDRIAGRG
jgi:hypothetical protein